MGTVGDALDNALAESIFASLQCELLDRHNWPTRAGLARAMFHYVEAFSNPTRRHSTLGYLSPVDYDAAHAARSHHTNPVRDPGELRCGTSRVWLIGGSTRPDRVHRRVGPEAVRGV